MPKKTYEKYENEMFSFRSPTEARKNKKNNRSVSKADKSLDDDLDNSLEITPAMRSVLDKLFGKKNEK